MPTISSRHFSLRRRRRNNCLRLMLDDAATLIKPGLALPSVGHYAQARRWAIIDYSNHALRREPRSQEPARGRPGGSRVVICWEGKSLETRAGDASQGVSDGAQKRTRTSTPLRALGPEPSASTNSAIWALPAPLVINCKQSALARGRSVMVCRNLSNARRLSANFRGAC